MKRGSLRHTIPLILIFGLTAAATAAPLDLKQVGSDAKWVGHVDLDAIRASIIAQNAMKMAREKHPEVSQHMEMVRGVLGFDPFQDVHGLTFYGTEFGKPSGVLLVHGKLNSERLLSLAGKLPGHSVSKLGDLEVHSWTHKQGEHSHTVAVAFFDKDRTVAASSIEELKKAVEVLTGKTSGVSEGSPLAGNIPPGTTVLFRAAGVSKAHLPHKNPLSDQTDSVRFAMGEHDGESFYRARAVMTNPEVVAQLKEIVEGARALAKLHCHDDAAGKKLVDALRIKAEGTTLTLLWKAPATDVWNVIESHAKVFAERMAQRRQHGRHPAPGHKDAAPKEKKSAEEDF